MNKVKKSLEQLLGKEYIDAVKQGAVELCGMHGEEADRLAQESVEFFPEQYIERMDSLLEKVGKKIVPGIKSSIPGAPTEAFRKAANIDASPLGGMGFFRLGEDGRVYLISKSEHYHTPLGHFFPGFRLLDNARELGITNATHNNTRGYITRRLEMELVRTANGLGKEDKAGLDTVLASKEPHVLNRVINLETGSLAVEAGVKMMLARFYQLDRTLPVPEYKGKIPVFLVMADNEGGNKANYHGTTVFTQMMRDLWPDLYKKMEAANIIKVCSVRINDIEDFKRKFEKYNQGPYKVAGFLHEIILMNYGGIKLNKEFLREVYDLCHANDTPVLCDEIQSCMWYPGLYLFREYGLNPDFVAIGKGFPGGQYPASRIITTYEMDKLNQFGALVTNGQEELAALSYLITMEFAQANESYIREIGTYYEEKIKDMAARFSGVIDCVEGKGHMLAIFFHEAQQVTRFTERLNAECIDISAQTYKAMCPPAALTKIPIISTKKMVDFLVAKMEEALEK